MRPIFDSIFAQLVFIMVESLPPKNDLLLVFRDIDLLWDPLLQLPQLGLLGNLEGDVDPVQCLHKYIDGGDSFLNRGFLRWFFVPLVGGNNYFVFCLGQDHNLNMFILDIFDSIFILRGVKDFAFRVPKQDDKSLLDILVFGNLEVVIHKLLQSLIVWNEGDFKLAVVKIPNSDVFDGFVGGASSEPEVPYEFVEQVVQYFHSISI